MSTNPTGGAAVREKFNVPAVVGMKIRVDGKDGVIVGFSRLQLKVSFNGGPPRLCDPMWRVDYPRDR